MLNQIGSLDYQKTIQAIENLKQWEQVYLDLLGKKGKVNQLFAKIKEIKPEERKAYGQKLNQIKKEIEKLLEIKKLEIKKLEKKKFFDPTLPGKSYLKGSLHPLTYVIEEIVAIFSSIGFIRVSYPEVEWEYFSFEVLNMPKGHPARDDFETFFIDFPEHKKYGRMVLSPHTSSGQNREMRRTKPPIRMINIAKTYRPNWDTTHTPMFHQFEGLCIDKEINITHLKGTIDYFVKKFFGENRNIRLRPAHFQFTEPSFEIDVSCGVCGGSGYFIDKNNLHRSANENNCHPELVSGSNKNIRGMLKQVQHDDRVLEKNQNKLKCKVCKSGWLELAGAGMVHPNVLKAGGIDPIKYSGWAFGFGPERCMMMREEMKIEDIRILYSGEIRFLEQF